MKFISKFNYKSPIQFLFVLLLGGIVLHLGKVIYAQVVPQTIYSCVKNNNGTIRIVNQNDTCSSGETALTWNQQGPTGPQGVTGNTGVGTTGATGATGSSGPVSVGLYRSNNLSNQNFAAENFTYRNFSGVNFANANLYTTNFNLADVTNANFTGAYFVLGSIVEALANGANFSSATVHGTSFQRCNCSNTNFSQAQMGSQLNNAIFTNANFTNTNMENATGTPDDVTGAIWSNTTCPDGTNSNNNGGTCVGHFQG